LPVIDVEKTDAAYLPEKLCPVFFCFVLEFLIYFLYDFVFRHLL